MTDQPTPLTDQQLNEIEAWTRSPLGPGVAAEQKLFASLAAEVRRLRTELAEYEVLNPQQCPKGVHADWLVDSEYTHACPWCENERLRARVAELEGPAVEARAALAALCYDLDDPGTAALGALHLLSQATVGVEAPRDDAALALAQHASEVLHEVANMADPEPPEVSFFGDHGTAVAAWLRMLADRRRAAAAAVGGEDTRNNQ